MMDLPELGEIAKGFYPKEIRVVVPKFSCGAKWKWAQFATSLYGHAMCWVESDSQMAQVVPSGVRVATR